MLQFKTNVRTELTEFAFKEMDLVSIKKEIYKLKTNKASQRSNVPHKIIKKNVDIFADFYGKA